MESDDNFLPAIPSALMGGTAGVPEMVDGGEQAREVTEQRRALVRTVLAEVADWCKRHKKQFEKMKSDTKFVSNRDNWQWRDADSEGQTNLSAYVANVTHRTIQQKVASLYARNPRVKAERNKSVDYSLWDGRPQTMQAAIQTVMLVQQQAMGMPPPMAAPPPGMGDNGGPPMEAPPPPQVMDPMMAMAIVKEAVEVRQKRDMIDRIGKTAEVLFHHFIDELRPRFKPQMKGALRRAATTGVAWVQLDFERRYEGYRPETESAIRTAQDQIKTLQASLSDVMTEGAGTGDENQAKVEELQLQLKMIQAEPDLIVREGLVFDFPKSWDIIPDEDCRQIIGLVGCKKLARRFQYTCDQIKARFNVDLKEGDYTAYRSDEGRRRGGDSNKDNKADVVWYEVYDSTTGLMYSVAEGYADFLCEPGPPRVKVDQFFPFYPVVLNEVENDDALFPPSEVDLMRDMQKELNRQREALRQHRIAAQPFWVVGKDKLAEDDQSRLMNRRAHDVLQISAMTGQQKITDIFQAGPTQTIDQNLYSDAQVMQDMLRVVGVQEANLGPVSGGTATEAGIAEQSRTTTTTSNVDDINDMLTDLADDSCAVMMREMSVDTVRLIAGKGAVWPDSTAEDYIAELSLKVVAGSMGKPNRERDAAAFERIMPIAVQVPGINPQWLARKAVELIDETVDVDDAVLDGIPSILSMNAMLKNAQPGAAANGAPAETGNPATSPAAQGDVGNDNMETGPGVPGGPQAGFPSATAAGPY